MSVLPSTITSEAAMSESDTKPVKAEQSAPVPQPQPLVQASTASLTQLTQIPTYIPPHVWTTDALLDLHDKQNKIALATLKNQDDQQKRANRLSWGGFVLIAVIIVFGLYLVVQGNAFGKDIIGATVLFLAGFLAGQGQKKSA